jgi:hypothetical protein
MSKILDFLNTFTCHFAIVTSGYVGAEKRVEDK